MVILFVIIGLVGFYFYREYKEKKIIKKTYYDPQGKRQRENLKWENKGFYIGRVNTIEKRKLKRLQQVDFHKMSGIEFEEYCMDLLSCLGYTDIKETNITGDYGVDILAKKRGELYGFQCKCYSYPVGIKAVQEIVSGIQFYKCDKAVVITNSTFTKAAERLSRSTKVELWDGIIINKHIKSLKPKEESANYYTAKQKLVMRLLITLNNRKNELQ